MSAARQPSLTKRTSGRPDDAEWRGVSWCDNLMRTYKCQAIRSPLEYAWVYKCSKQREFGMKLMLWLGLNTIPPDILYNPMRLLWVAKDIIEGVFIYYSESWGKGQQTIGAFFDRLIELRIDPILTFKALDRGEWTLRVGYILLGEIDVVRIAAELITIVDKDAGEFFRNGTNNTATVINGLLKTFSNANVSSTVSSIINATTSTMPSFVTLVKAAIATNMTNSSKYGFENDTLLVPTVPELGDYDDLAKDEVRLVASTTETFTLTPPSAANRLLLALSIASSLTA